MKVKVFSESVIGEAGIANFVCSCNGEELLVVTDSGRCGDPPRSVLRIDIENGNGETLIEGSDELLYVLEWLEPVTAILRNGEGNEVELDVEGGGIRGR